MNIRPSSKFSVFGTHEARKFADGFYLGQTLTFGEYLRNPVEGKILFAMFYENASAIFWRKIMLKPLSHIPGCEAGWSRMAWSGTIRIIP